MSILATMNLGLGIPLIIGALVVGLVAGFFISRHLFKAELKKHPPINEKMIRVMMQQMGRKPSEAQIKSIMKNISDANK